MGSCKNTCKIWRTMQSYVHTHASCASRSSKLCENSSSRRPKKIFFRGQSPRTPYGNETYPWALRLGPIGPRLRSTDKSPKNPLKFEENFFFGSNHQNGSPHIKSCSTDKRRQQIIHEKVIQNQAHEGTKKSFHEEIMIIHVKASKKNLTWRNHVWRRWQKEQHAKYEEPCKATSTNHASHAKSKLNET